MSLDTDKSNVERVEESEVEQVEKPSPKQEVLPKVEKPKSAGGRRASDEYKQINAFISKSLHKEVRHILIDKGQDLSSVIEKLLQTWVLEHKSSK